MDGSYKRSRFGKTSVGLRGTTASLTTGRLVAGSEVTTFFKNSLTLDVPISTYQPYTSLFYNKQLNVQPTKINSPLENSRLWPISARTNQALRIGWIDYKTNLPTNS